MQSTDSAHTASKRNDLAQISVLLNQSTQAIVSGIAHKEFASQRATGLTDALNAARAEFDTRGRVAAVLRLKTLCLASSVR